MLHSSCKVQSCIEVASKTFLLKFLSPQIAGSSLPGQFVNVLTSDAGIGPLLRRPFSISRIEGDRIELIFHAIGTGTSMLSHKQSGDLIDVIGPLGSHFEVNGDYDTALIVAGGIGMAPFPFLTEHLKKSGKRIETLIGFRTSNQVYSEKLQNVHLATDDGSKGFRGNVIQMLESILKDKSLGKIKIFACGPTVMLRSLIEYAGHNNICCEVSLESYMACGVGICQGCPVELREGETKYALTCKDGPIFHASRIKL